MKNSIAIALLLGVSVEAVELDRRTRRHVDTPSLALKKAEYKILEKDIANLRRDYDNLKEEEAAVHHLSQPLSIAQHRFAEGYKDEEELGENLDMIEWNARHNDGWLRNYKFIGGKTRPFAEGMTEGEKIGETIHLKDADVNDDGTDAENDGLFPVHLPQKKHPYPFSYSQHRARPFAEGMSEGEKIGETIHLKDRDVNDDGTDAETDGLFPVHLNQRKRPTSHAQKQFAVGYADDEELGEDLSMTEWNTRKAENWQRGYKFAKGRRPHTTSYTMLEGPLAPGIGFPNTLADAGGPLLGRPGLPSQSPLTAQPEKEWQQWAQDLVDWEDNQTDMANTRLPYASTLLQLQGPLAPGIGFPNTLALPGPNAGYPGLPTQSPLRSAPEKEWQDWAQDLVDWEDNQTDMANTRLPYASTLLQIDGYNPSMDEKKWHNWVDLAQKREELIALEENPAMELVQLDAQDPTMDEKKWEHWANFVQREIPNPEMNKPVDAAFVHFGNEEEGELVMINADYDPTMDEKRWEHWANFVQMETSNPALNKPVDAKFVSLQAPNDDPSQLEDFVMEDPGIPLNMRL